MGTVTKLSWRVEGMDCAGCVAKVTRAVERMPGVTDVQVNLMAERLSASLAPGETTPEAVTQHTGFPCSIVNPFEGMEMSSNVRIKKMVREAPSYLTSCGLAMRRFMQ